MIHNEHLRKADELYEIRHDNCGNALHVYIKDGYAKIFGSLDDFIRYIYKDDVYIEFIEVAEEMLETIYESTSYTLSEISKLLSEIKKANHFSCTITWIYDYQEFSALINTKYSSIMLLFTIDNSTYAFDVLINDKTATVISKQFDFNKSIELK